MTPPHGPRRPDVIPPAPYLGNGRLWVGLWPEGLVVIPPDDVQRDGFLRMKFMWVRGPGVHGILHISGDEVGTGDSIRARTRGYGLTGFNASSISFPTEGCYRITGAAGGADITFVTLVRTCEVLPDLPHPLRTKYATDWCTA